MLSVVGGWIWKPAIFTGDNNFEKFMAPVFEKYETATPVGVVALTEASAAAEVAPAKHEEKPEDSGMEHILMFASVFAGLAGAGLAYFFYVLHPEKPAEIAASMGGLYQTVKNKYYVDEIYDAAIVEPIVNVSTEFLWKQVDAGVVDGTVNGAGTVSQFAGDQLRKMQSGNIRSYAGWVVLGAALLLAYTFYMGLQ